MQQRLADSLTVWPVDTDTQKEVTRSQHGPEETKNVKVTAIKVSGFASPEGPRKKGPSSIRPGNIDRENIDLAAVRGGHAYDATRAEAQGLGLDVTALPGSGAEVGAEETQFSDAELEQLQALSEGLPGKDVEERIFNLIVNYNENSIDNPVVLQQLDALVGSKRKVTVTIDFQGGRKETTAIPLPLLMLPLFWLALRRRKRESENNPLGTKDNGGKGRGNGSSGEPQKSTALVKAQPRSLVRQGSEVLRGKIISKEEAQKIFSEGRVFYAPAGTTVERGELSPMIRETQLPDTNSLEYKKMEEGTVVDDLMVFFDDKDHMKRGLDYRQLADLMESMYGAFKDDEEREAALASEILMRWKENDKQMRKSAGVQDLESGLDYENQPNQILYARMHARALIGLVEAKMNLPTDQQKDVADILKEKAVALQIRRIKRGREQQ